MCRAGLGSSAAFSAATAAALLHCAALLLRDAPSTATAAQPPLLHGEGWCASAHEVLHTRGEKWRAAVNALAFRAECVLHGATASGVDNAVAVYGGVVRFCKGEDGVRPLTPVLLPRLRWMVVDTHVPKSTQRLVAGVRARVRG